MSKKILNGLEILEKIKNNELSISQEVSAVGNSPRGSIKFVLDKIDIIEFINMNFELIEDEIDIDSIEEIKTEAIGDLANETKTIVNKILQWAKQTDKEIKELKEKT